MNNKNFILIKSIILFASIFLTACEEDQPELSAQDHHDLAKLYFKQGSFKASIIEGKNAIQLKPDDVDILITMAKILLKLSDANTARELINRGLTLDKNNFQLQLLLVKTYLVQSKLFSAQNALEDIKKPSEQEDSIEYDTLQADFLLASNKPKEAKKLYLLVHKKNKKNIDVILGIAKTALSLKQLDEVEVYTSLAVKTAPTNIQALLWQAQTHMFQNNHREAESVLSRVMIELERHDTLTAEKYAAIDMLAKTLVAQGKIQESFTYSNYLAQSRPGQIQASYNDALALIEKNVDINKAEKAFQDVLNQAPQHKQSGIILGLINYQKGNYTEANEYLTKFASGENSPLKSKKILALTKIKLNKVEEAIQFISENIKINSNDADFHALLGLAYLKKRDAIKSIDSINSAIKLSATNSDFYSYLSRAHLLNKDIKNAIKHAKKALTIQPSSKQGKLSLISAYTANNSITKAKKIANNWLKEAPESLIALNILASLEHKSNQINKAKTIFKKILLLSPYDPIANYYMANYDLSENKKSDALNKVALVFKTQPTNTQALTLLLKLSTDKSTTDKALSSLYSVIADNPKLIIPRLALIQLYLNIKKPKKAISIIEDVTKIDNKNTQAYLLKARAYFALNNYNEAIKTYHILNSLNPESEVGFIELGKLNIHLKNFNEAIKNANQIIAMQPTNTSAHIILATSYLHLNSKDRLLQTTNIIKKNTPDSHIPYEIEASFYYNNNQYRTAISLLKKAWLKQQSISLANKIMLAYKKNNQPNEAFKAWDELAKKHKANLKVQISYSLSLYNDKQYLQAATKLEHLLRKHPENVVILNNLATVYHDSNNEKALATAQKALSKSPDNPAILDTVGWIYVNQLKDYDKGLPLLKRAYQKTSDPQIKEHLTAALIASGKTDDLKSLQ